MDPNTHESPALALPSPSFENSGQENGAGAQSGYHSPEAAPAGPEAAVLKAQPTAALPAPMPTLQQQLQPAPLAAPSDPQAGSVATASDDTSITALDEEWINKAKAIVERTKTDPYIESKELGKAKADYLRVRYNKQVKVVEDTPR